MKQVAERPRSSACRSSRGTRPVLPPGGPVHRPALETGASSPADRRGAGCTVSRLRRPPDELTQGSVMRTVLLPRGERLRAHCAKQRPALGIDHGHDDLRAARRVEHNPVQSRADTGHRHELAYGDHVHKPSLPQPRSNDGGSGHGFSRAAIRQPPGSLQVVDDLARSRPLLGWNHEVDVATAEAVRGMVRHTARLNTHRTQLIAPCHGRPLVLERADRLPPLEARVPDRHRFLLGDATLEEARNRHASSLRGDRVDGVRATLSAWSRPPTRSRSPTPAPPTARRSPTGWGVPRPVRRSAPRWPWPLPGRTFWGASLSPVLPVMSLTTTTRSRMASRM